MNPSRAARGVLAGEAALFVLGVILASRAPGPRAWALHLPGFLPPAQRTLVMALLVLGAALLALDLFRGDASPEKRAPSRPGRRPSSGIPAWAGWLLILPWAWLLGALHTRTHFLGDGTVWLRNIQVGRLTPFSEPLAAAVWSAHARLLHALEMPGDAQTAAFLPILCGVLAGVLLYGLAREIAPRGGRLLALALLATMGWVQLYFG